MDVTKILEAVIVLVLAVVTTFLVPYIKSKTTKEQRDQMESWAKIAVTAAEQIYNGVGRGEEKKQYVLDFLKSQGYTLDIDAINALVESAVRELKWSS